MHVYREVVWNSESTGNRKVAFCVSFVTEFQILIPSSTEIPEGGTYQKTKILDRIFHKNFVNFVGCSCYQS